MTDSEFPVEDNNKQIAPWKVTGINTAQETMGKEHSRKATNRGILNFIWKKEKIVPI